MLGEQKEDTLSQFIGVYQARPLIATVCAASLVSPTNSVCSSCPLILTIFEPPPCFPFR